MQRNFILTDVMKTGQFQDHHDFINMHSLDDQSFELENEYYRLHNHDLDSYTRRFAIVDVRHDNLRLKESKEFGKELKNRCDILHSQGFKFISATTWESKENIKQMPLYPELDIEHVKWTGGVSWFWFYMYDKHKDNKLTVRQKLEKHKEIPQCYSCHKKIDDLGLAMENFDVIGRWNKNEKNETAGLMPDGTQFSDFNEMKSKLMTHKDKMIEGIVEALIAYSLNRESEFSDQDFVEEMVNETRENSYSFKALLKAFIKHEKFTHK